jgi:hypothetical protein
VKLRELLKKIRLRSPEDGKDERPPGNVNEAFTVSSGEAPASWIPSQQDDRPRH